MRTPQRLLAGAGPDGSDKMAAPWAFEPWLEGRLEALGLDGDVYGGYIRGVLREAECDAERLEGLAGALAAGEPNPISTLFANRLQAFVRRQQVNGHVLYDVAVRKLVKSNGMIIEQNATRISSRNSRLCSSYAEVDEDALQEVCREIVEKWSEAQNAGTNEKKEDEIQAIASIIEKQAQIVVKPKGISKEETLQKAALLAQYAEVTDEEDEAEVQDDPGAAAVTISSEKSLFKNTNLEDVVNARKLEREHMRDESQRKKDQDRLQREKDKLSKQERKEKEKKRTQKGERKR